MASSTRRTSWKDDELVSKIKHFDTFYGKAPPGLLKKREVRPEDCIPDKPENKDARDFLSNAPTKGLWMPLGKQVKVMKCWRCKAYGHRTADKECPLFIQGNAVSENFRVTHEDPMHEYILKTRMKKKEERIMQLQALLDSSTTDSDNDDKPARQQEKRRRKKRSRNEKDGQYQREDGSPRSDVCTSTHRQTTDLSGCREYSYGDKNIRADQKEMKEGRKRASEDVILDARQESKVARRHDRHKRKNGSASDTKKSHEKDYHRIKYDGDKHRKKKSKHKKHKHNKKHH
ncbi:uncharacterized protein LOC102809157 [Saccoglossus kowalevskii]|uniref:Retinitis pigmentosa 9 protein-like n=1 Tax=Saccoglossus kowalevskii TaxID=10224 RepID=A0ABM0MXK9_SACKO|nr:PREDICTED: retinitis pigmentosa 9 protein-like [Saccoglossus kowalevskii]